MSEICAAMGRKLTRARRRHKLSLHDVSEELCISLHHLKALESGRLEELPGPVYALGFLRNYAELVDLDADELAAMAKDCLALEADARRPHLPEPHRESRFPARLLLVGATAAMLFFFTAWPMVGDQLGSEASIVPVLPAHLAARLRQPSDTAPVVVPGEAAKLGRDQELFLGERQKVPTAMPPETPKEETLGEEPGEEVPELEIEPLVVEAPLEIRATRDTWVVIKNEKDQTLLRGLIRSGDSFVPERTARLKLTASDGGNLVLYVRGKPVAELGEPGYELRSLKIDVAGILKGTS